MSFENPTPLRMGMTGSFNGIIYRVVGRSVMGENEDGETYYWNEFNLTSESRKEATLVFEQTDNGGQWRIFTLFEPEYPMTAADAATKRVGDSLNLTGTNVRVTFRGSSRVYYVEGQAPEGEDVGSVAEYFNAEGGGHFQVVSWTGDEVEFYKGVTLNRGMVASAFELPPESEPEPENIRAGLLSSLSSSGSGSSSYSSGWKFALQAGLVVFLFLIIFGRGFSFSTTYESAPVKKTLAPPPPLEVGASGKLFDKHYRVSSHAVMEIAEVGANWDRHEYELTDDSGTTALLVCGEKADGAEWVLFEPLSPMVALTAKEAAAKQVGDPVDIDGFTGKVSEIFLCTIGHVDGSAPAGLRAGAMTYGFSSVNEYRKLLCRWNNAGVQYFRGKAIAAKKGAAGFTVAK